jgi:hypothetical protein
MAYGCDDDCPTCSRNHARREVNTFCAVPRCGLTATDGSTKCWVHK